MSTRHRSRYSTPRRSFEEQQRWLEEKEPAHMHAAPVRTGVRVNESLLGGTVCGGCGVFDLSACECPSVEKLRKAGAL